MTEKNLIKTNYPKIVELFESAELNRQLSKALPKFLTVDKLIRISLTTIRSNPKLLECSQQSLIACLFGCAQLGLDPNPYLGQVYFVPFWNSKLQSLEATFMPGYRGYVTLWRRSGVGENITAQCVYQNDEFKVSWGLHDHLIHTPAEGDRGPFKGVWTVFRYKDASPTFDYMPKHDVDKIMERTKSRNAKGEIVGPWITDYDEMAKKTVIRRHFKLAPASVEDLARAIHAEETALIGESQRGFFLPDGDHSGVIEIEGGSSEKQVDENQFEVVFGDQIKNKRFSEFLKLTAESNQISLNEVKSQALKNPIEFKIIFDKWEKSQKQSEDEKKPESKPEQAKPETQKPEDQDKVYYSKDDELISTFKNKQRKTFSEWLEKHREAIPHYSDKVKSAISQKCANMHLQDPFVKTTVINEGNHKGESEKTLPASNAESIEMDFEISEPENQENCEVHSFIRTLADGLVCENCGITADEYSENQKKQKSETQKELTREIEFKLEDTDEWKEFQSLKRQNIKVYMQVVKGQQPKSMETLQFYINEMKSMLDQTGSGIPAE